MQIFDYISSAEFYHNMKLKTARLSIFTRLAELASFIPKLLRFKKLFSVLHQRTKERSRALAYIFSSRWEMSAQRELLLLNRRSSLDSGLDEEFDIGQLSQHWNIESQPAHIQSEPSLTTDWRSAARTKRRPWRPWDRAMGRDMVNLSQAAPQTAGQISALRSFSKRETGVFLQDGWWTESD